MERSIQQELKTAHSQGQGYSPAKTRCCASSAPSSSRSTKNGPPTQRPTSSGNARMHDPLSAEFPDKRLLNRRDARRDQRNIALSLQGLEQKAFFPHPGGPDSIIPRGRSSSEDYPLRGSGRISRASLNPHAFASPYPSRLSNRGTLVSVVSAGSPRSFRNRSMIASGVSPRRAEALI